MGFHTLDPPPAPPPCSCLSAGVRAALARLLLCPNHSDSCSRCPSHAPPSTAPYGYPENEPVHSPSAPGCQKGKVQIPQLGGKETPPPTIPILHLPAARPPDSILFQGHATACFCHNEPLSLITTVITILLNIYCMFPNCSKCALPIIPFNFPNNSVDGVGTIIISFYR